MIAEKIIRNFKLHILSNIELEEPYLSIYLSLDNVFNSFKCYMNQEDGQLYYGYSKKRKHDLFMYFNKDRNNNLLIIDDCIINKLLYGVDKTFRNNRISRRHCGEIIQLYISYKFKLKIDEYIHTDESFFLTEYLLLKNLTEIDI